MSEKTKSKNKALGRGLGSLLGGEEKAVLNKSFEEIDFEKSFSKVLQVRIDHLKRNLKQPRKHFKKQEIEELANSIKEYGILQPILVREKNSFFEIIAGERRWRAAQLAGLKEVPVIVQNLDDRKTLEAALIENIQRENLNLIEEAKAYDFLLKEYKLTQEELAKKMGKQRSSIANTLRLLSLDPFVQNLVFEDKLSFGHAKVLMSLETSKQKDLAKKTVEFSWSLNQLKKAINSKEKKSSQKTSSYWDPLSKEFSESLGSKVVISGSKDKGVLQCYFYSLDQLEQWLETLKGNK